MTATPNPPPLRIPRELLATLYGDGIPDRDDMKFPCPACHDRPDVAPAPLLHEPDGRVSCSTGCDEDQIRSALWPAPRHLVPDALPPFPVDALPDRVALYVEAVAASIQVPVDLVAGVALAVASTSVLGALRVELGPGWTQEPALYMLGIAAPGERKTNVVETVVGPLHRLEDERQASARPEVDHARAKAETLDRERKRLLNSEDVDAAAVAEIDAERRRLDAVRLPRMLLDDATPEALAMRLSEHGSLGVLSDEGALLAEARGRHNSGRSNFDLLCKAYDASRHSVDRVKAPDDPLMLPAPRLALGLLVQPSVAGELLAHDGARGQGLVARFVILRPTSLVGTRNRSSRVPIPAALADEWDGRIRALAGLPRDEPRTLTLSNEAREAFHRFEDEHEPRMHPGSGDLASIVDWANKHPGRVGRVALLLHALGDDSAAGTISGDTMRAAIRIGDHMILHALAVLDGDRERRELDGVLSWLARTDKVKDGTVKVRDLYRDGPCHGGDHGHEVARRLAALGYLRELQRPTGTAGRPSSPAYAVHPLVGEVKPR
jgi:hypothetical protein